MGPTHETDGDGDALSGEETVVVFVCDVPYLAKGGRHELCAAEYSDCDVSGEDTNLLGVSLSKDLVHEGELCGCRREKRGHGSEEKDVAQVLAKLGPVSAVWDCGTALGKRKKPRLVDNPDFGLGLHYRSLAFTQINPISIITCIKRVS